jgi:hypothetical protein
MDREAIAWNGRNRFEAIDESTKSGDNGGVGRRYLGLLIHIRAGLEFSRAYDRRARRL